MKDLPAVLPVFTLAIAAMLVGCTNKSDRFVEIDGHRQHILDKGEGSPVVIFITGAGADLKDFDMVQSEIADYTRTLSYDRAGIGLSEELDNERTVDHFASELHQILEHEKIEPPYVLVGHELGGFIVRWFAHAYPNQVAGMVLIDPAYEGFMDSLRNTRSAEQRRRMKDMVDLGIINKPKASRKELEHLEKDEALMRRAQLSVTIPITMLTSGRFSNAERDQGASAEDITRWVQFHERLKEQAPQLKHIVTERSGSRIHQEEPELVIAEIKTLLEMLRVKSKIEPVPSKSDSLQDGF
ncbi:MAG: alpha/beta hydrolase [Cyclobacteriaceae bacterium]|nr:alpha/beta hydrolase [Cyclobacteriaceae bacterium]